MRAGYRPIIRHFSERELTFTFAICCRPSVCRLSVGGEIGGALSCHGCWPSCSTVRESMDVTEIGRRSPAPVTGDVLGTGMMSSFPDEWNSTLCQRKID